MYDINKYLTKEERLSGIRAGFLDKMASMGITPSGFEKAASSAALGTALQIGGVLSNIPDAVAKAIKIGLIAGVPAGIALHALGASSMKEDKDISRLEKQREYYRDITSRINSREFMDGED